MAGRLQPRLVLLGRQGAGKGTQAARIVDTYSVQHVSTGDMFRSQAAAGTAFGLEAKRYMDAGDLVPDEIVVGVIEECLAPGRPLDDGFVLDGVPRTLGQAKALDDVLGDRPLTLVIDIEVPRDVVIERISGRRVCERCQRVYHLDRPPARPWECDACGGAVMQRADDTAEAVARRLDLFERETRPIIDYYGGKGLLAVVDGIGEADEVFDRVAKVIDDRLADASAR